MKKIKKYPTILLSSFVIILSCCNSVLAGPEPNGERADKWSGPYIGIGGGYGELPGQIDMSVLGMVDYSEDTSAQIGYFSATAGYDLKVSNDFLIGGFVEFDTSSFDDASLKQWSVGGRVGYIASNDLLLFVSGGYTNVELAPMTFANLGYPDLDSHTNGKINFPSYDGWFAGAGGEYMIYGGWSLRAEYRYTKFGHKSLDLPEMQALGGLITVDGDRLVETSAGGDTHTIRATLNYRF
ncbi:MAG: outer membrane protein [Methyloligellaceae bacterium]